MKRVAHAMSMCHWRHVTCDIHLEGDIRKYIIAIIQSECMISTGGITTQNMEFLRLAIFQPFLKTETSGFDQKIL